MLKPLAVKTLPTLGDRARNTVLTFLNGNFRLKVIAAAAAAAAAVVVVV